MTDRPARVAALAAALGLTVTPPVGASVRQDDVERAVVRAVNAARAVRGVPGVRSARSLARVADGHSRTMARTGVLSHTGFSGRLRRASARGAAGEVVAAAPRRIAGARRVVRMWLGSPAHRAVLLDGRLRRIGVGRRNGGGTWFFTAELAARVP